MNQMDIFAKCDKPSPAKELIAHGVYPYFHALESRQDVEVIMDHIGINERVGLLSIHYWCARLAQHEACSNACCQ